MSRFFDHGATRVRCPIGWDVTPFLAVLYPYRRRAKYDGGAMIATSMLREQGNPPSRSFLTLVVVILLCALFGGIGIAAYLGAFSEAEGAGLPSSRLP